MLSATLWDSFQFCRPLARTDTAHSLFHGDVHLNEGSLAMHMKSFKMSA